MNIDNKTLTDYGASLLAWTKENWLILLLIAVVAFFLFMFIGIPLFRKYIRSRKKEKDTSELKKDLRVWQEISEIASESDKKDVARQSLSSQLNMIRLLFSQGIALLKHAGKGRYGLPWFVLVGEPKSGKSTLLKESRLEIVCSSAEGRDPDSAADSLPVRCWLSGRAFVLDIGGKVFFDRWMGGSSAEWNLLLKLIVKAHKRNPLSGIILTIPADALLADSEELTKRKAALLVNEFQNMLGKFGMYLPCHVIVTKMDMLMGFREFFCDMPETEADGIFGWRNHTVNGRLDTASFSEYCKNLVDKLRSGAVAAMSGASIHTHNQNSSESRLLLTGGMYIFPDEFAKIKKNLTIYLDRLFGTNTWLDNERAMLSGVYFTSSKDGHVRLSSKLAEICDVPVEKAVLVSKTPLPKHSIFTKNLLDSLIFTDTGNSSFTAGRKFRRHIPLYVLCLFFVMMSGIWGYAALQGEGAIRKSLLASEEYYKGIASLFESKSLEKSPLVILNAGTGKPEIAENLPLEGNPSYTRLQFFFESQQEPLKNCRVPFGFRVASWFTFQESNYGLDERNFIANRIQSIMVFTPTVNLLSQHFTGKQAVSEPFTAEKREAYKDFIQLENVMTDTPRKHRVLPPIGTYLRFLTPETSDNTIRLLDSNAGKDLDADIHNIADIIYQLPYQKAEYEVTLQIMRHLENLTIYPDHPYSRLRTAIRNASVFMENQRKIQELTARLNGKIETKGDVLAKLRRISETQVSIYESIAPFFNDGTLNWSVSAVRKGRDVKPDSDGPDAPALGEYSAREWIRQYEQRMDEDYAFITASCHQIEYLCASTEQTGMKDFIEKSHKKAKAKFAEEKEDVAVKGIALRDSLFFAPLPASGTDKKNAGISPRFSEVVIQLLKLSNVMSRYPQPRLKSIADFPEMKRNMDKIAFDAEEQFEAYAKNYASDPKVAGVLAGYRSILKAHKDWMRYQLYSELLSLYPDNSETFASMIAENAKVSEDILGMKAELAGESFGNLKIMNAYENNLAMLYVAPIAGLLPAHEEKASVPTGNQRSTIPDSLKPRFGKIVAMLGDYLEKYNAYWAGYVDAIKFTPGSWSEFKAACGKIKPYQINTLLFIAYNSSADILNQVPDVLLSKTAIAQKVQFMAVLNAKKQILAPHFSESCNRNVSAWHALPNSAAQAFLMLQGLSEKQRNADYLTVFDTGAKGDIPWWSSFIQSGVSFMKQEAKDTLLKKLGEYGEKLFSFPLCRNSPYIDALNDEELRAVSVHLANIGCPIVPPPADVPASTSATPALRATDARMEADASGLELVLDFPRGSQLPAWGTKLQGIIDALTNDSKPMTYSLTLPSIAVQNKLTATLETAYPLAVARFPYLTVFSSETQRPVMRLLQSGKDINLISGLITENALTFAFRSFSDEEPAAASVKISGDWVVLRLYLSGNSYFDPQTKLVYSPLFITDKMGGKYVLWIGFSFNKVIPFPDDWPTTVNCPDFSLFQTDMKLRRNVSFDLSAEILKVESGENGYRALKKLIRDYEIKNFPVFTLAPVDDTGDTKIPENYLRFPYLEVKTPERSVRISLVNQKGAGIPLLINDERIQFRFFRHSDDITPAHEVTVSGPYSLLRLLTWPDRAISKKSLTIKIPLSSADSRLQNVPLKITIKNERGL